MQQQKIAFVKDLKKQQQIIESIEVFNFIPKCNN